MELLDLMRRRWLLVSGLPLLVAVLSLAVALLRPPEYAATARLLVTRSADAVGSQVGVTPGGEDKAALDLPAIISGQPFRQDLAQVLVAQGRPASEPELAGALRASATDRVLVLQARAGQPDEAVSIAQAAVELIRRNGLRYWGDPLATPDRPGLNVAVLEPAESAEQVNGPRALALEVGLRALVALIAGAGLAVLRERFWP